MHNPTMAETMESHSPTNSGSRPSSKSVTFAETPELLEKPEDVAAENPELNVKEHVEEMATVSEPTLVDLENHPSTDTTSLIFEESEPEPNLETLPAEDTVPATNEVCSETEDFTPIHSLSDKTLEQIFCFLDIKQRIRIESVCRRWRNVCKNVTWKWPKKLIIDNDSVLNTPVLTDDILLSVLSRCGFNLKKLTLTAFTKNNRVFAWGSSTVRTPQSVVLTEIAVGTIAKYCINLVELKLMGIPVTDEGLQELAKRCVGLKYVNLRDSRFGDEGLTQFFNACTMIEGLEISGNDHIKGECFKAITKNLQILRIYDSQSLQPALVVQGLTQRCDLLQELRITQCDILMDQNALSKMCLKYKDTLKILHLEGYDRNSELIQQIRINWCQTIGLLRSLQELSLRNCDDISDDLMPVLAKNCLKLSVLNVSGTRISDEGLRHLASAPSLKVLDISDVSGINGEGLDVLAGQGLLEEVFARHNHMISPDESCSTLALFCPNFRVLDVSETMGVSSMLVTAFCICIKRGFVKGPIKLIVGGTAIRRNVETCEQLHVIFQNTCSQNVLFDLLSNYDDSDSDGSDW